MNIFINGESLSLNSINDKAEIFISHALEAFLNDYQQQTTFAVALNSDFIGRDQYGQTPLKEGDSIDVLFPIQGG